MESSQGQGWTRSTVDQWPVCEEEGGGGLVEGEPLMVLGHDGTW